MNILEIQNLEKKFGGISAVSNCSLNIEQGTITGLIGPNGAGKSTLFNLVAGALKPDKGNIVFENKDITGVPAHQLFHSGIVRTFQIPHEFQNLTVLDNLIVAAGIVGERCIDVGRCYRAIGSCQIAGRVRIRKDSDREL